MRIYKRPRVRKGKRIGWIYWLCWRDSQGKRHQQSLQSFFDLAFPITDPNTARLLVSNHQISQLKAQLGVPPEQPGLDVGEFYRRYFRFCERVKSRRTIRADKYRFKRWLAYLDGQGIGNIVGISPAVVRSFIQEELQEKSNTTINIYVSVIRASLQWAVREGHLEQNPAADIARLPIRRRSPSPAFHPGDLEKLFSIQEVFFLAYLKLIYYTLMRRSEALSLTWEDVDLERGTVYIRKSKSRHPRTLPLSPGAIEALRSIGPPADKSARCDLIFPWREHSATQKFRRLRKKLHLAIEGLHHFRHLCASEMLRKGANPRAVQELLGHRSPQTTLRIYAHVSLDDLRKASRLLETPNVAET